MSLEHDPARSEPTGATGTDDPPRGPSEASDYWHALIDEKEAAAFLKLTDRTMQGYRHRGGGPRYVRLSSRCIRYRRVDLREWADACIRTRTSDPGQGST